MIGKALKFMRTKCKMSQKEVGDKVLLARNTISQYETETIQPTFATIEKIANICGFNIYFEDIKTKKRFDLKTLQRKE
ncbi:MAG: helix-turn-helix transcriptional regulator [Bacilli bacterium]|nr:helix-turn-helix transcriptional regulator [Bacilli bacterium]